MANEAHFHWFGQLRSTPGDGDEHSHDVELSTGETHRSSPPRESDGDHVHSIVFGARTVVSGPAVRQGKLAVSEMVPTRLNNAKDEELLSIHRRLHQLFGSNFAGNSRMTVGDLNREHLVNAALFVWAAMKRRDMAVSEDTALWRAVHNLAKCDEDGEKEPETWLREETYATVLPAPEENEHVEEMETLPPSGD